MGRLFLTPREFNFISDITKELMKDVVGQKIYYYPINEIKTKTDEVYNEALKKVFDRPIALDALVDTNNQSDTKINSFGVDAQFKLEVYLQWRDLVDKGIQVAIGDFFSFSDIFYEVTERVFMRNIYGMPEHKDGVKLIGTKAREDQFQALIIGPTDISRPESDAVQTTFHQQRGEALDADGNPTGDKRELQVDTILDKPITGAKEVSPRGDTEHSGASAFFDEDN
jgi:hypothetical protein